MSETLLLKNKQKNSEQIQIQYMKNKKILQQLQSTNQSLKLQLNEVNKNVQNKIRPQHIKLNNQRIAIYKLLGYDKQLSLRQNYSQYIFEKGQKKNDLLDRINRIVNRNEKLLIKSINYSEQIQENEQVKNIIKEQKIQLQQYLLDLQQQKLKKLSIKQSQQYNQQNQHQSIIIHNLSNQINKQDNSQTSINLQNININILHNNSQLSQSNKEFVFHQDVFNNASEIFYDLTILNKPKSKEIINSLEKQLNPLKLNQIIYLLENQIQNLQSHQLHQLKNHKFKFINKSIQLKNKENHLLHKIQKMKIHINQFKTQIFGSKLL